MRRFLRKVSHGSRVRVPLVLAVGAALLAAPSAGAGGEAGYSCPPSFAGVTLAQDLNLPRHQAGLAAGAFSEDFLISEFNRLDRNGDGMICAQDVAALNGGVSFWQYVYNLVDDNASVPSG